MIVLTSDIPLQMFRRQRLLLGSVLVIAFIFNVIRLYYWKTAPIEPFESIKYPNVFPIPPKELDDQLRSMANALLSKFRELKTVPEKINVTQPVETSSKHQGDKVANAVDFKRQDLEKMQQIHVKVVQNLPQFPSQLFSGQGIVMVGGGRFLRIAMHSIRMLRRTGTTLPVE